MILVPRAESRFCGLLYAARIILLQRNHVSHGQVCMASMFTVDRGGAWRSTPLGQTSPHTLVSPHSPPRTSNCPIATQGTVLPVGQRGQARAWEAHQRDFAVTTTAARGLSAAAGPA
jgi:hypothetical protein